MIFFNHSVSQKLNGWIQIENMLDYPPKILLAFSETFGENEKEFRLWLLENGYKELAALSSGIKGNNEAIEWLLGNKYPQYAAFDGAIDKNKEAIAWLRKYEFSFLEVFADAVNEKEEAIAWLNKHDLKIFVLIAAKISHYRNNQTFDYHKLHF